MDPPAPSGRTYRFGLFEADLSTKRLLRQGERVKLQDQPFRVLGVLLERPGEVVTRQELRQALWPGGTWVEFDGSLNAALKRLRHALGDSAENPIFIETVPRRGYRFLAPVSGGRPPRNGAPGASDSPPVAATGRAWRRRAFPALALALAVLIGTLAYFYRPGASGKPGPPRVPPRRSLAVLGFANVSGRPEDAWLSTAFSEMLSTELAAGDGLRLTPGEDVAHLRVLSPWPQTGVMRKDTSSRIGVTLESELLVLGSYMSVGGPGNRQLRLDLRLQEASSGRVLLETAESGSEDTLFQMASSAGGKLRQRLGLPGDTSAQRAAELVSLPSTTEAARFYATGLDKLRQYDGLAARDLFEQAAAADPKFPLTHTMLSRAWGQLGYDRKCRAEAKKALDLSGGLSRTDRLLVEGVYDNTLADPEKSISAWRSLSALFPDNVDYGLQLALRLNKAGRYDEALETIRRLQKMPPPVGDDARLDILEGKTLSYGHHPPSSVALERGLKKAAARGQKLVYAGARSDECAGAIYSDRPQLAIPACQEAYQIFMAAGNRVEAASALRMIADRISSEGRQDEAWPVYEQALRTEREAGARWSAGATLNNMAIIVENKGQLERAEGLFLEAKRNFEDVGDPRNAGIALVNIADIQMERGKLEAAEKTYVQAREMIESVSPLVAGYTYYQDASLQLIKGEVKEARRLAGQALKIYHDRASEFQESTEATIVLGDILMAQDDLAGARKQYEQAVEIPKKLGDRLLIAEARTSLAALDVEEGHANAAEAPLREAVAAFHSQRQRAEIDARIALSRCLRAEGRGREAAQDLEQARRVQGSEAPIRSMLLALEVARVEALTEPAAARRRLLSLVNRAGRFGCIQIQYDARLTVAEIARKQDPSRARALFNELRNDARASGFERIASKARF